MFRSLAIAAALSALLFASATASPNTGPTKVALLPLACESGSDTDAISDVDLSTALLIELTRTREFQLIEFATVEDAFEDQLLEDAVLELLVTEDLKDTLETLNSLTTETGKRRLYTETAGHLGVDYLIEVKCKTDRNSAEITYSLIEPQNHLSTSTRTVLSSRGIVAGEVAKRITRDLWRIRHTRRDLSN